MKPRRAAIIVGVNGYDRESGIRPLEYALTDCTELHGFLKHRAGYDAARLLLDPNKGQVLEALEQVTATLGAGDLLVFFFAGHGLHFNGKHLLLCQPARMKRVQHFDEVIPVDQVRDETDTPGLHRLIILDCCRSELLRTRDATGGTGLQGESHLRDLVLNRPQSRAAGAPASPGALALLCSCSENMQALELPERGQGLFTAALLEEMAQQRGAGREVRFSDVFRAALEARMGQLACQYGHPDWPQRPMWQLDGTLPPVLAGTAAPEPPPAAPAAPGPAQPPSPPGDSELDRLRAEIAFDINEIERAIKTGKGSRDYLKKVRAGRNADWSRAAELGLPEGLWLRGRCLAEGLGVPADQAQAARLFARAAALDSPLAQFALALCYENGEGVAQDKAQAVRWYRQAAEQGYALAQNNLGLCYAKGEGVAQDLAQAVLWYRKAAEQQHAVAQFNLGLACHDGQGVAADPAAAVPWFRQAAEQGHARAQNMLGVCYANGQGVPQDHAQAVIWLHKAAQQGNRSAQSILARGIPA